LVKGRLEAVAPGPELARVLAGIELSRLSGYDCVEVLKAQYQQLNQRAQLMAAMVEVELSGIGPNDELPRRAIPDEFSADEVRTALVLTRRVAHGQFWLAHDLVTRLPEVHAALDAGLNRRTPRPGTVGMEHRPHSRAGPRGMRGAAYRVPTLIKGQLIDQIKKLALAIDPQWG
jgi:hypothetical protein